MISESPNPAMAVPTRSRRVAGLCAASILLLAACAPRAPGGVATAASPPAASTPRPQADIVPFADYHAHIYSINAATQRVRPLLAEVQLPPELAGLLRRRVGLLGGAEAFRNRLALSELYTPDAVFRNTSFRTWGRGAENASVNASLQATFGFWGAPFRMTPVAYGAGDSVGYVAGYYTRGQADSIRHVGQFHLSLRKGADGAWRIGAETASFEPPALPEAEPAEALIADMDAAGVRKALVLSAAYWGASITAPRDGERAAVQAENDWVAEQVARYPDRLVGFCAVNPLRDYALDEVARCAAHPHLRGIKLHVADANVDLENPDHLRRLRRFFQAANEHRMPITAHVATQDLDYGREHVRIYLEQVFPAAPDIPIQIAHLAGHGPAHGGDALAAFAEAARAGHPAMRNVYFDVASNVMSSMPAAYLDEIARRLREIGLERVLFATDRPAGGPNFTAKQAWAQFRRLPLTEDEFRAIADNVAPYVR
ncbi:MAG: amidohydrolase family protein [Gemmatimonadetes bacterium]|nr:amidohydrolase family protein [Gemmatimonadota bacterium]